MISFRCFLPSFFFLISGRDDVPGRAVPDRFRAVGGANAGTGADRRLEDA